MPEQTRPKVTRSKYIAMTSIVCWNIAKKKKPWTELLEMDADVALLQEADRLPSGLARPVETGPQDY